MQLEHISIKVIILTADEELNPAAPQKSARISEDWPGAVLHLLRENSNFCTDRSCKKSIVSCLIHPIIYCMYVLSVAAMPMNCYRPVFPTPSGARLCYNLRAHYAN